MRHSLSSHAPISMSLSLELAAVRDDHSLRGLAVTAT